MMFSGVICFVLFFTSSLLSAQPVQLNEDFFSNDREGVEKMLTYILEASPEERISLTEELKPTIEDCEALFKGNLSRRVYKAQKRLNRQARIVVRPLLEDQTEFLLWGATTQELLDYSGEARFFPGGYHELSRFLEPGYTFYRFKFIQPGRKLGSAYDMLVNVNGNWKLIHRPWTVMFD